MKKYPSDLKMRWRTLSPLEVKPQKIVLWDEPPRIEGAGAIFWPVACAVVWAIVIALVIYHYTAPLPIGG